VKHVVARLLLAFRAALARANILPAAPFLDRTGHHI
jgi:hypothetical protein